MRCRSVAAGLVVAALAMGIRDIGLATGSSRAATGPHKRAFLRQQANQDNPQYEHSHRPSQGLGPTATTSSSPSEIQGWRPTRSSPRNHSPNDGVDVGTVPRYVCAGSAKPGVGGQWIRAEGEIGVWVFDVGSVPWQGQFVVPGHTGPIAIENFQGHVATWTSTSGKGGMFNIVTHTWSVYLRNVNYRPWQWGHQLTRNSNGRRWVEPILRVTERGPF